MAINKYRTHRFQLFLELFNPAEETKILDVGGTSETWQNTGLNRNVTLLNVTRAKKSDIEMGFQHIQADAVNMEVIQDRSYDIVFSNSVIEHLGSVSRMEKFADEIRRVGKSYWIQTPNKLFPIEPHLMFPMAQFLPSKAEKWIALNWPYSNYRKWGVEKSRVVDSLNDTRLLSERELKTLFPKSTLHKEKVAGLTKSLVAWRK